MFSYTAIKLRTEMKNLATFLIRTSVPYDDAEQVEPSLSAQQVSASLTAAHGITVNGTHLDRHVGSDGERCLQV